MDSEPPEEIKEMRLTGWWRRRSSVSKSGQKQRCFFKYTRVIGKDAEEPGYSTCGNDNFCIVDKGQIKGVFPPY